ncbi:MAG TPA: hypothetical protein VL359_09375, partial [bacterium]|nr:hypothetical protein [bacterium]
RCADRFTRQERVLGPLAFVVLAQQEVPQTEVYQALSARLAGAARKGIAPRLVTVGDARAPRQMGEAILHAHRTVLLGG